MHTKAMLRIYFAMSLIAAFAASACGGGQSEAPPPESPPAAEPATEPPTTGGEEPPADEGVHTMPDGTTMPGHDHGDGSDQPDAQ